MNKTMTAKQQRFCDEYLIDLNATGGSGGGGNGAYSGTNAQPTSGAANTGGGGGGMYYGLTTLGKGGSGIAVIRNHR